MNEDITRESVLDFLLGRVRAPIEKHADEILAHFEEEGGPVREFQYARLHLDKLIARLENDEFSQIAARLGELSGELRARVKDMERSLGRIEDFGEAADVFARIVGLAARVIALA
ncbi:MAG: hypothetical protein M3547_01450 [Acidobacteriota bacterium]|nr:hypothetical protein [Acidobacteriota bacterium]